MLQRVRAAGAGGGGGATTVTVVVEVAVLPRSSTTLHVTSMMPGLTSAAEREPVALSPAIWPAVVAKEKLSGRFCGLRPSEVMVETPPGRMLLGLAEQEMVGGSYAWMRKLAAHSACWVDRGLR